MPEGFQVEKNTIRLYKYKFMGISESEITFEAYSNRQARLFMREFVISNIRNEQFATYLRGIDVNSLASIIGVSERVSMPVTGETKKTVNNTEMVWFVNNWIPIFEYEKIKNTL